MQSAAEQPTETISRVLCIISINSMRLPQRDARPLWQASISTIAVFIFLWAVFNKPWAKDTALKCGCSTCSFCRSFASFFSYKMPFPSLAVLLFSFSFLCFFLFLSFSNCCLYLPLVLLVP